MSGNSFNGHGQAMTLPGRYYTAADLFQKELEQIFYERWLCAGRVAEQLPRPGSYFLQQVGQENVIVIRGRDDQVRAFYNVCRHRGSRICLEPHGQLANSLQCPYHAWTYGLDGRLIGAPHMNEDPTFNKNNYPLHQVAAKVWDGFVFINLSSRPEPFEQAFAPMIGKFEQWLLPQLRVAGRIEYQVAANWKLLFENYNECYHCPLVHPALTALSPYESGSNDLTEGPFLGGPSELNHEVGSLTLSGMSCAAPIGQVGGEDLHRVYYYSIFPNMLLSLHPDYVMVHTMWPKGADQTHVICEWLFEAGEMARPGFDPTAAINFWDMTNRQDWHVCEISQLGVSSRAYTPGPYSPLEDIPIAFDQEYLRAIHSHHSQQ